MSGNPQHLFTKSKTWPPGTKTFSNAFIWQFVDNDTDQQDFVGTSVSLRLGCYVINIFAACKFLLFNHTKTGSYKT